MKNGINRLFYSEIIRRNCVSPKMSESSISHEGIKYNDIYWWLWWMVTGGWFRPFYRTCWIVISNIYIVFTYSMGCKVSLNISLECNCVSFF